MQPKGGNGSKPVIESAGKGLKPVSPVKNSIAK